MIMHLFRIPKDRVLLCERHFHCKQDVFTFRYHISEHPTNMCRTLRICLEVQISGLLERFMKFKDRVYPDVISAMPPFAHPPRLQYSVENQHRKH